LPSGASPKLPPTRQHYSTIACEIGLQAGTRPGHNNIVVGVLRMYDLQVTLQFTADKARP
jgi:hypothetical protein